MPKPVLTKTALVVVRTYPVPSMSGVEVSCTGAITAQGEWLRLHPVPYRLLEENQRFRKYQWIELKVSKSADARLESYRIKRDSIRVVSGPLSTAKEWRARKAVVVPMKSPSLCWLNRECGTHGYLHPTLGVFKPKSIKRLIIEPDSTTWTPGQLVALQQGMLFEQPRPQAVLEKVPFRFKYEFCCEDEACLGSHTLMCTDWEMGQAWRRWKTTYADDWQTKFRERFERDMIEKCDTHFYVGTVFEHPGTWIIVGLFYPPKPKTLRLF
ncbi:MAG: hypothetical protein NTV05_03825 [Acidobacteria bacterium]|nr:hypothetical protein [Acidobacteriota bacterium]